MITYRVRLDAPRELVLFVSRLLATRRREAGTRKGTRSLGCYRQALFVLAWYRDKSDIPRLGAGFGISQATSYRYVAEGTKVVSAQAPGLEEALERAVKEGTPYVILDVTGRRTDGRGERLFHPGQHHPGPAEKTAARRSEGTRHLLTSRQLASKLGVTSSTILRWTQLGLLTTAALDNRGFNLYQPGQPRPTRDQITTACRPPGTGDAITGGQLAARHGVSRSAVYKWHQLGLIDSLGTDGTGRNLYHPGQQAPSREQIRTARAARRHGTAKCQAPVPSSVPEDRTPPITTTGIGSATRGAV